MSKKNFIILLTVLFFHTQMEGVLLVGTAKTNITPPIGTPSAGYAERRNVGMTSVHDPLYATTIFIYNGLKKVALCSVDNFGYLYPMTSQIKAIVNATPGLEDCEVFIFSSNTSSGSGAIYQIPIIEQLLSGPYDPVIAEFNITQTVKSILLASQNIQPALLGVGYTQAPENLGVYRSTWPEDVQPSNDITVIKITKLDNTPLAVIFNYALKATALGPENLAFSADYIGYARTYLQALLGSNVEVGFINGASAEIIPNDSQFKSFALCDFIGKSLAQAVFAAWPNIGVSSDLNISILKDPYLLLPQPSTGGFSIGDEPYPTEINAITFNNLHNFITIPGELSCVYYYFLQRFGPTFGLRTSVFGLANDAQGYIITPEAYAKGTQESAFSFGGPAYGAYVISKVARLINIFFNPFASYVYPDLPVIPLPAN
ncbi:MAG: hypothetical protein BGO10_00945 [Chlamydia sp. 32-24]|nr:MAG: hypothetical protein BGO10_00945 [Chlamydia sp. 32-24]